MIYLNQPITQLIKKMIKFLVYGLVAVALFSTGYRTGAIIQENEQAANEAYLRQVYEKKQDDIIEAKDAAIDLLKKELSAQVASNASLRVNTDRLQRNLQAANAKLSTAKDSCIPERQLLGECNRLLITGTGLLERGVSLLRETAANNDALIKLMNTDTQEFKNVR